VFGQVWVRAQGHTETIHHCLAAFHCCEKTLQKINLKEERFILAHSFRVCGHLARVSGPMVKRRLNHAEEFVVEQSCSTSLFPPLPNNAIS
jgi:hypothetical protein